jgi:hypothetical protein
LPAPKQLPTRIVIAVPKPSNPGHVLTATDRSSTCERKSTDGDGGDGDDHTPDESRRRGKERRRDARIVSVHEWWATGKEAKATWEKED